MNKGKRYSREKRLNYKKVFAVIIALIVLIITAIMIKNILSKAKKTKPIELINYFALYKDEKWGILGSDGNIVIEPMYQEMPIVIDKTKDIFLCIYDIQEENETYKTKVINKENQEIWTEYDKIEALENYDDAENVWYEENVLKVQKNGLWGLINTKGEVILEPQFTSIKTIKGIKNSLIVEKDGVVGLVNDRGSKVLETEYLQILRYGQDYKNGYIIVNRENKYGLVSAQGEKILEPIYETVENIYNEKYYVVKKEGNTELIDKKGETILKDNFDKILQIAKSGVIIQKGEQYGLMDFEGNMKIDAKYKELKEINEDIFLAKKEEKYGVIDIEQNEKIAYSYNKISYNEKASLYIAENDNYLSTILNSNFEVKLTGILSKIDLDNGYMKIKIGDEYKYYNFKFEEKNIKDILSTNKLFVSKQDGKYGFVDNKGNVVVDYKYEDAQEANNYGYAAIKKDGKWGAIDSEGTIVIEPHYNLDENLVIDFIGKWHLGLDLNMNYYCEK